FSSLLGNTVNVTTLRAGTKTNVIPKEVTLELDGRLLPGQKPEQLIESLSSILSLNREQFSVLNYVENPQQKVDWTLFPLLADTIADLEPDVEVIPLMLGASTDARHFAKLGIQTYGFLPMNFSPDFHFFNKIHGVDECIPLECLEFGIDSIKSFLRKYSEQ
ncbi:MAG: peptidase dimerization domain-containing protein, partial [Bacteroidota bacterium]